MAARQMGVTTGGNIQEWIGTLAERDSVATTNLGPGSTFWDKINKIGYIWDGESWISTV